MDIVSTWINDIGLFDSSSSLLSQTDEYIAEMTDKLEFWRPLAFSLFAGLSTTLGGALVLGFRSSIDAKAMAFSLMLAAGVMMSVSFTELLAPLWEFRFTFLTELSWMLGGFVSYVIMSKAMSQWQFTPAKKEGEEKSVDLEAGAVGQSTQSEEDALAAYRLGLLMMITLTAHNLPEGIAVAIGSLDSVRSGLVVMLAIALHNIPEGIAIAVPIYAATGSRWKALSMTLASGLSEPLGAALGLFALQPFLNQAMMDNILCAVGGLMVAVCLFDLIPEALKYRERVPSALGFALGWGVMSVTLQVLG